eukprot:bmy_15736T0
MDRGATGARGYGRTTPTRGDGLLGLPLLPPWIRTRPWWFPVQELRNPVLFYLEAWLADLLFGPDRAIVPKMEWMSLAPLTVDTVKAWNLVEITVFGWPDVQHLVKSRLLSLASRHPEHRARDLNCLKEIIFKTNIQGTKLAQILQYYVHWEERIVILTQVSRMQRSETEGLKMTVLYNPTLYSDVKNERIDAWNYQMLAGVPVVKGNGLLFTSASEFWRFLAAAAAAFLFSAVSHSLQPFILNNPKEGKSKLHSATMTPFTPLSLMKDPRDLIIYALMLLPVRNHKQYPLDIKELMMEVNKKRQQKEEEGSRMLLHRRYTGDNVKLGKRNWMSNVSHIKLNLTFFFFYPLHSLQRPFPSSVALSACQSELSGDRGGGSSSSSSDSSSGSSGSRPGGRSFRRHSQGWESASSRSGLSCSGR